MAAGMADAVLRAMRVCSSVASPNGRDDLVVPYGHNADPWRSVARYSAYFVGTPVASFTVSIEI